MSAPPPNFAADDDTAETFEGEEVDLERSMGFLSKSNKQAVETAAPVAPGASASSKAEPDPEQAVPKPAPSPAKTVPDEDSEAVEYTSSESGIVTKKRCCLCCILLVIIAATVCAIYFGIGPEDALEIVKGAPEPTEAPTVAPTTSPTAAPTTQLFADILALLLPYTPEETLLDSSTPQGQAFRQLVKQVEESGGEPNEHRVLQRYALMTLYLSTNPSGWTTRTGWNTFTQDECDWFGIGTCRAIEQKEDGTWVYGVANIELGNNNLEGPFPSEMCAMAKSIESIDVSSNALTGSIPACLKDFVKLTDVNFSDNNFTGELPTGLLGIPTMSMVDFSQNQIGGEASNLFGDDTAATDLNTVRLHSNVLTGDFPPNVSSFSGLSILMLHGNELTGEVPATVCEMQGLNTFLTTLTADCLEISCTCCTCY